MKATVHYYPEMMAYKVYIYSDDGRMEAAPMPKIIFRSSPQAGTIREAALTIDNGMGQEIFAALADALWDAGFRPSNYKDPNAGPILAHLDDMRQIAFAKLNVEKPKADRGGR